MDSSLAGPEPGKPWYLRWLAAITPRQPWYSLWFVATASLACQLALCQFFTFGHGVPISIDVNPSNLWKYAYHFPPRGEFLTLNWFGIANLPPTLNPFSLAAAHFSPWLFFTAYAPLIGTAALLAMVLFLRELELPRPAALFGGVVYAWQGDLLPFVFPGHYGYITTWPFFALAAWAAVRAPRSWAYALIAGASCGMMIGMQPDRGSMVCLLIATLYLGPIVPGRLPARGQLTSLVICAFVALLVSLGGFLALFKANIVGVKLGGTADREQLYALATQFSLSPVETLTYLVPGFFGWHSTNLTGPYWGWIGQSPGWEVAHQGTRNFNLAISTTGTVSSLLALLGLGSILPSAAGRFFGRDGFTPRQLDFARVLALGAGAGLLLSWGYHTPLYRIMFALPLMDKWRDPLKWLEYFNFGVVVLGALGFAQVMRSLNEPALRRAVGIFLAASTGLLFILIPVCYLLSVLIAAYLTAGTYEPTDIASVMHTLHVSVFYAFLMGALLWLFVLGAWHGDRLQTWDIVNPWLRGQWRHALAPENRAATLVLCASLLVGVQMVWVTVEFIEPVGLATLTSTDPLLQSLKSEGPLVRVAVPQPQDAVLNTFLQNQFAADRISSIDISAASRIPDQLTAFVTAFTGHTARLWEIGGVKNVAIAQQQITTLRQEPDIASNIVEADGYTLAPTQDNQPTHAIVRMRDYLAKAIFVPNVAMCKDDADVLKRLAHPTWDPRRTVLLSPEGEGAAQAPLSSASAPAIGQPQPVSPDDVGVSPDPNSAKNANIPYIPSLNSDFKVVQVTHYTPHQIDLTLNAPAAGYVLINDQFDPDWQVTVSGQPAPLLRADYLLRAIQVPAGESSVSLRYVAHYSLAGHPLPVVATNNFSDAVMLLAFIGGGLLVWRESNRGSK